MRCYLAPSCFSSVEDLKSKFCSTVANDIMLVSTLGVIRMWADELSRKSRFRILFTTYQEREIYKTHSNIWLCCCVLMSKKKKLVLLAAMKGRWRHSGNIYGFSHQLKSTCCLLLNVGWRDTNMAVLVQVMFPVGVCEYNKGWAISPDYTNRWDIGTLLNSFYFTKTILTQSLGKKVEGAS